MANNNVNMHGQMNNGHPNMQSGDHMGNNMGFKQHQQQPSMIKKVSKKITPNEVKKRSDPPKSPAVKKPKEIQYVKIIAMQQHYKVSDFKDEALEEVEEVKPELAEGDDQIVENPPTDLNADAGEGDEEDKLSDREPENHDNYEESVHEENNEESQELYDSNEIREIEINSKHKASNLKKVILDSISLFKKANIILYKEEPSKESNPEGKRWVEFTEDDLTKRLAKDFAGQTIAFKVYMEIHVKVDGRG